MKLITDIKDIEIQGAKHFYNRSFSSEDIWLWETGHQYICSINNSVHILKNLNTNENFKIPDKVYKKLLTIGKSIHESNLLPVF